VSKVVLAVVVTLATQTIVSTAIIAPSVIAPAAAGDLGVAPQSVGIVVAVSYMLAMVSGLTVGEFVTRFGPLRTCQLAVLLGAGGLALGASGSAALIFCAMALIGCGYGMVTPTSSHILVQAAPRDRLAFIFSIKQTGVPIGGALAGALIPPLVLGFGWHRTLLVLAAGGAFAAIAMQPVRARFDQQRELARRTSWAQIVAPVKLVAATPALRVLAALSLVYAQVQLAFITYFVSFLNLELGLTLVAAGLIYAAAHGASIAGRIAWGAVADRMLSPRIVLAALGFVSCVCGIVTATATAAWSSGALIALGAVYGASAVGWNGVYLAEVARSAPEGQVGAATGGTQFFTFSGALSGPPLFAAMVWLTGGYRAGFVLFAALPALVGLWLLATARAHKRATASAGASR
jgi:MFS family permease